MKLWLLFLLFFCIPVVYAEIELSVYVDDVLYLGESYNALFKIVNKDHVSGVKDCINLSVGYNISGNDHFVSDNFNVSCLNSYKRSKTGFFEPNATGNYTISGWIIDSNVSASKNISVLDTSGFACDINISVWTENFVYFEGESVKFYNNLNNETFSFVIEYWIEDLFGNIYKKKYNTSNTNKKSWKTKISEQDRVLFIKSQVYALCNDTNLSNNFASKMFIVEGNLSDIDENGADSNSSLEIVEIKDEIRFGEVLNVKIKAYKGNTSKYSLSLHVEKDGKKASNIQKIHIYDKFSSYNGLIGVPIKNNCDLKLKEGEHNVILKGLGTQVSDKIKIKGVKNSSCTKQIVEKNVSTKCKPTKCSCSKTAEAGLSGLNNKAQDLKGYNIINQLLCSEEVRYKQIAYESKNEKIKRLIRPFTVFMLCILCFILVYKH